jgi:hypothetical protein
VSVYPANIPDSSPEGCRALLNRLPGIYAAGIRTDGEGTINEIHILANSCKNPKQLARDIQSALLAAYNLEIDYRIISIAQLSDDPTEPESATAPTVPARLRYKGAIFTEGDGRYTVKVTLARNGCDYSGFASCRDSAAQRVRAVAQATLAAVHEYLGNDDIYTLVAVQTVEITAIPVAVILIEHVADIPGNLLIGAARSESNEAVSIVKATLDALNRSIGRLAAQDGV